MPGLTAKQIVEQKAAPKPAEKAVEKAVEKPAPRPTTPAPAPAPAPPPLPKPAPAPRSAPPPPPVSRQALVAPSVKQPEPPPAPPPSRVDFARYPAATVTTPAPIAPPAPAPAPAPAPTPAPVAKPQPGEVPRRAPPAPEPSRGDFSRFTAQVKESPPVPAPAPTHRDALLALAAAASPPEWNPAMGVTPVDVAERLRAQQGIKATPASRAPGSIAPQAVPEGRPPQQALSPTDRRKVGAWAPRPKFNLDVDPPSPVAPFTRESSPPGTPARIGAIQTEQERLRGLASDLEGARLASAAGQARRAAALPSTAIAEAAVPLGAPLSPSKGFASADRNLETQQAAFGIAKQLVREKLRLDRLPADVAATSMTQPAAVLRERGNLRARLYADADVLRALEADIPLAIPKDDHPDVVAARDPATRDVVVAAIEEAVEIARKAYQAAPDDPVAAFNFLQFRLLLHKAAGG